MDTSFMRGTGVALITPFNGDKTVDFEALEALIHSTSAAVDYLVVLGTTGESATLTPQEGQAILDFVMAHNVKKLPIVFGDFGGNNTADIIARFNAYNLDGVQGILSSSPAYNKPTQEGIFRHYEAISKASHLPIILYNVPGRTCSDMSVDTIIRLAKSCKNIVAVKDASSDFVKAAKILHEKPSDFKLLSGDDATAVPLIAMGGEGVISVMANALPKTFCKMINAALENNWNVAQPLNNALIYLDDPLYAEGNPVGVKTMMQLWGKCKDVYRLPLVPMSEGGRLHLQNTIKKIEQYFVEG